MILSFLKVFEIASRYDENSLKKTRQNKFIQHPAVYLYYTYFFKKIQQKIILTC